MPVEPWGTLVTVGAAAVLALAPWMLMVHAKLAVIANEVEALNEKMEKVFAGQQQLWTIAARHEVRLDTHAVQIAHLQEQRVE